MNIPNEINSARVSEVGTKQAGEIQSVKWGWVERSVWNDRMLEALDKGVKKKKKRRQLVQFDRQSCPSRHLVCGMGTGEGEQRQRWFRPSEHRCV